MSRCFCVECVCTSIRVCVSECSVVLSHAVHECALMQRAMWLWQSTRTGSGCKCWSGACAFVCACVHDIHLHHLQQDVQAKPLVGVCDYHHQKESWQELVHWKLISREQETLAHHQAECSHYHCGVCCLPWVKAVWNQEPAIPHRCHSTTLFKCVLLLWNARGTLGAHNTHKKG